MFGSDLRVKEFRKINDQFIKNTFNYLKIDNSRVKLNYLFLAFLSRLFLRLKPNFCLLNLILTSPQIVLAQVLLRSGGLKGSYQWERLYELKRSLKKYRPIKIIEFGSGASTLLFHQYNSGLNDQSKRFIVLEEDEIWRNKVLNVAKKLNLKGITNLENNYILSKRIERAFWDSKYQMNYLVCHYEKKFYEEFDFGYVDGPTNWIQNNNPSKFDVYDPDNHIPNIDVSYLKSVKVIFVDGRRSSVRWILENLVDDETKIVISHKYQMVKFAPYHTIFSLPDLHFP